MEGKSHAYKNGQV